MEWNRTERNAMKEISTIPNEKILWSNVMTENAQHIALWDSITCSITLNRLVTPEIDQSVDHKEWNGEKTTTAI